jgi:hypothetical protein
MAQERFQASPLLYAVLALCVLLAVTVAACWTVYDYTRDRLGKGLQTAPPSRGER